VLAFDYSGRPSPHCLLGDVVVSIDVARRVSKERGISFGEELTRYAIHGLLHLVGYDDVTPAKKRKMWQRQEELVRFLKADGESAIIKNMNFSFS